ncbi:MAG TPA: TolC family protein [Polyangia bacterium]|jgi:cobalt-zinc-cadmium efflux system outer membrane protein
MPAVWPRLLVIAWIALGGTIARAEALTMDRAVAIALERNRDVIAAKLEIDAAALDVVAARVYPNPTLQYQIGDLVLGSSNPQNAGSGAPPVHAGFWDQPVQSVGVSDVVDIWAKRAARIRAADGDVQHRRLLTEDALREIVYAVRSAFADVVREQSEDHLAHEVADRYAATIRISQARFKAGDISEAELRKIELEGLKYQNDVIDADSELDLARGKLAALLSLRSARELPGDGLKEADQRVTFDLATLTAQALDKRPDLRAAGAARTVAEAEISAARREALPDITLGASYTHSDFQISGDNPNTLGFSISLPLPIFDRNQANIGRARLDLRRAENDGERLRIAVATEVAEAVRRGTRAVTLLAVFERAPGGAVPGTATATTDRGGMIGRAETALQVAEKSYRAGALSLLELLEAQRTYLDTRAQYLHALHDFQQAIIDVKHAAGES